MDNFIGNEIRSAIKSAGVSQTRLAAMTGASITQVNQWVQGYQKPTLRWMRELDDTGLMTRAFGVERVRMRGLLDIRGLEHEQLDMVMDMVAGMREGDPA